MLSSVFLTSLLLACQAQAGPLFARQATAPGEAQNQFLCPPGVAGTLASDSSSEFGLRFCSRTQRWNPADLFSSTPINITRYDPVEAAARCAVTCRAPGCETFSVAPSTPRGIVFGCNLYNQTRLFNGTTNGGLFYARQSIVSKAPVPKETVTVHERTTVTYCPPAVVQTRPATTSAAAPRPTSVYTDNNSIVHRTQTITEFETRVVAGATRTVTNTVVVESKAPAAVFNSGNGKVEVVKIINQVTVIVVVVEIKNNAPVTTVTSIAPPTASASSTRAQFLCPTGISANYIDSREPSTTFNLKFCSNTLRWSPADLFNSTQIVDSTYELAARACSLRCTSPQCVTFSVAPTTVGGSTFGCNLYSQANVFMGPTNGGLFYQREPSTFVAAGQDSQCLGSAATIGSTYNRIFCSRTERWSPADLFSSRIVSGTQSGSNSPLVQAAAMCATQCDAAGNKCLTFSTTLTSANPPTQGAVQFNCNLYNATNRVQGATNGGAFYQKVVLAPVDQCQGAQQTVANFERRFCSATERWAPATLFNSAVVTGSGDVPIIEAINTCASRCNAQNGLCRTFSTTLSQPANASAVGPINYNCNLYNATSRVLGATNGGAFYENTVASSVSNSTMIRRFAA